MGKITVSQVVVSRGDQELTFGDESDYGKLAQTLVGAVWTESSRIPYATACALAENLVKKDVDVIHIMGRGDSDYLVQLTPADFGVLVMFAYSSMSTDSTDFIDLLSDFDNEVIQKNLEAVDISESTGGKGGVRIA